jgi:hypothetical protein
MDISMLLDDGGSLAELRPFERHVGLAFVARFADIERRWSGVPTADRPGR